VRPGGHIYPTVEEQDPTDIEAAFAGLVRRGVPAVRGEVIDGDVVICWIAAEGLGIVDEGFDQQEDWGYRHLLLRSP
jgi:hypothetical protein